MPPPPYDAQNAANNETSHVLDTTPPGFAHNYINYLRSFNLPRPNYDPTTLDGSILSREDNNMLMSFGLDENFINFVRPRPTDGFSKLTIARHLKIKDCNLVRHIDEEDVICVICQDDLCQEKQKIATLDCGHEYHEECIKKWLVRKNLCPICNAAGIPLN
ncbi:hypothetical protein ACJIZ3_024391 [Penstemon smallii]|uniref:RING-type E3 ubiquitin transferase n=1 Tax=Penstemon smallii TaxID=265156 RepID=A0ABD3TU50_9LAMI